MIDTFTIPHRKFLGLILEQRNLNGIGVEVGVEFGRFSDVLLRTTDLKRLVSIDRWDRLDHMYRALTLLKFHGMRSECRRSESAPASLLFENSSLDFAYLDAGHHLAAIREDIRCWWPKVRRGGMFSGHDYTDEPFGDGLGNYGVKQAVDEFVKMNGLRLHVTKEFRRPKGGMPSWFVFK